MKRQSTRWLLTGLGACLAVACGPAVDDSPSATEVEAAQALSCAACSLELCVDTNTPAALRECLEGRPEEEETAAYTCVDAHNKSDEGPWARAAMCSIEKCACEDFS